MHIFSANHSPWPKPWPQRSPICASTSAGPCLSSAQAPSGPAQCTKWLGTFVQQTTAPEQRWQIFRCGAAARGFSANPSSPDPSSQSCLPPPLRRLGVLCYSVSVQCCRRMLELLFPHKPDRRQVLWLASPGGRSCVASQRLQHCVDCLNGSCCGRCRDSRPPSSNGFQFCCAFHVMCTPISRRIR